MIDLLDRKIRQMHEALGGLQESDLSSIQVEHTVTGNHYYCGIDFSQGKTEVGLANVAFLLIANIACMKDHLKVWCSKNNKAFQGDNLISNDRNVALVHDLWNIDKHAELNRPPRSGHLPKLHDLHQSLNLSTGPKAGNSTILTFDPKTGEMLINTNDGGSAKLLIGGQVVDEHGALLGDFADICEKATAAWEEALKNAGVTIPSR